MMSKLDEIRALGQRRFARAQAKSPAKASRGSTEGRARPSGLPSLAEPVAATGARVVQAGEPGEVGIKPSPRWTKTKARGSKAAPAPHKEFDVGSAPAVPTKPKGRPLDSQRHLSTEANKPWETAVPPMSRRTWYRRQAEKAKKNG